MDDFTAHEAHRMAGVDSETEGAQLAQEMISRRVTPETSRGYRKKLLTFGKWLEGKGNLVDSDGYPTLPVQIGLTIQFFGSLLKPRLEEDAIFGTPRQALKDKGGHYSASHVGGYKSALVWLYTEKKMAMDPLLSKEINLLLSGYRKATAEWKQKGEMPAFEGKRPLCAAGYEMSCNRFVGLAPCATSTGNHRGDGRATTWEQGLFCWLFLILQWNLIARYEYYKNGRCV
jgi:hypothetical protein